MKLSDEGLSQELFEGALDVMENVLRRSVEGGPSPREVKRMIEDRNNQLMNDIDTVLEKLNSVQDSIKRLEDIKAVYIARGKK